MTFEKDDLKAIQKDLEIEKKKSGELDDNALMQSHRIPGMAEKQLPSTDLDFHAPSKKEKPKVSTSLLMYGITDDVEEQELLDDLGGVTGSQVKKSRNTIKKEKNQINVEPLSKSTIV